MSSRFGAVFRRFAGSRIAPFALAAAALVVASTVRAADPPIPRKAWERERARHAAAGGEGPAVFLESPSDGLAVSSDQVRISGSTDPRAAVTVNGRPFPVLKTGAFAGVFPLQEGTNRLRIEAALGGETTRKTRTVTHWPVRPVPGSPLKIDLRRPAFPEGKTELPPGAALRLQVQASPGAACWFEIGDSGKRRPMPERPVEPGGIRIPGVYAATYVVADEDAYVDAPIRFTLEKDGESTRATAPGRLTVVGPGDVRRARILTDDTGLWIDPERSRRLQSLDEGAFVECLGRLGAMFRVRLGAKRAGWVRGSNIRFVSEPGEGFDAELDRIDLEWNAKARETVLRVTLNLPFAARRDFAAPALVEPLPEEGAVRLVLPGVVGETPPSMAGAPPDSRPVAPRWGRLHYQLQSNPFIHSLDVASAPQDGTTFLFGLAGGRLWGYDAAFERETLVLRLKAPPEPNGRAADDAAPLKGRRILVDAGHGGVDDGAVGAGGMREADANLEIVRRLRKRLEKGGAEVELLRAEDRYVSLDARSLLIARHGADLFLSIHNNSIDAWSDPLGPRGTRLYYYHDHSRALAETLMRSIRDAAGDDAGAGSVRPHRFRLLRRAPQLPGALVECFFLSNPYDEARLLDPARLDSLCEGIYNGVVAFFDVPALPEVEAAPAEADEVSDVPFKRAEPMKTRP